MATFGRSELARTVRNSRWLALRVGIGDGLCEASLFPESALELGRMKDGDVTVGALLERNRAAKAGAKEDKKPLPDLIMPEIEDMQAGPPPKNFWAHFYEAAKEDPRNPLGKKKEPTVRQR